MKKLKDIDYKILFELIKNSKITDRKLARIVGVSQPTVTRRRANMEKEGLLDYTAIPNFEKLGFEILAFTFARWNRAEYPDEKVSEAKAFLSKHPNIIFVSTGRGLDSDRVCISFHKDYADYTKLMKEFGVGWGCFFARFDSFVVSLRSDHILRNLTFKHLAESMK